MKRALFLIVVIAVLIGGGYLSTVISRQGPRAVPGVLTQTNNPEASVTTVTPEKGAIFFIFVAIALGSVVGMGVTIAIIFWFLNRQVARAKQSPNEGFNFTMNAATPNSVGGLVTARPAVTITLVVLALIALSAAAAVVLGVFNVR
ncbi:MAG: hypothetical protein IT324_00660 [Anaerolineae bacterium]|nr:hypothetical protein [Anaerolineae bacterium]